MNMNMYIKLPFNAEIQHNPVDFGFRVVIHSLDDLDDIIKQCRDIKLIRLGEVQNDQN